MENSLIPNSVVTRRPKLQKFQNKQPKKFSGCHRNGTEGNKKYRIGQQPLNILNFGCFGFFFPPLRACPSKLYC